MVQKLLQEFPKVFQLAARHSTPAYGQDAPAAEQLSEPGADVIVSPADFHVSNTTHQLMSEPRPGCCAPISIKPKHPLLHPLLQPSRHCSYSVLTRDRIALICLHQTFASYPSMQTVASQRTGSYFLLGYSSLQNLVSNRLTQSDTILDALRPRTSCTNSCMHHCIGGKRYCQCLPRLMGNCSCTRLKDRQAVD